MATNILFPEWNIWTQFLQQAAGGLRMDALEKSHPIEVRNCQYLNFETSSSLNAFKR